MPKDNPLGYLLPEYGVEAFPGYQVPGMQPDGSFRAAIPEGTPAYNYPPRAEKLAGEQAKQALERVKQFKAKIEKKNKGREREAQGAFTHGIATPAYEQPALPSNPQELAQHALRFTSMQRALDQNGGQPLRYTDPISGQVYLISRK